MIPSENKPSESDRVEREGGEMGCRERKENEGKEINKIKSKIKQTRLENCCENQLK